jgi:YD repeat-containing protein
VQHDVRGNITALGALSMVYDYSDQMRSFTGSTRDHDGNVVAVTNRTYTYNGEGKRVRSVIDGVTT